jgi:hypothetical protein
MTLVVTTAFFAKNVPISIFIFYFLRQYDYYFKLLEKLVHIIYYENIILISSVFNLE